ncbi:MAG: flagellar basal body rod protein FlgC [Nitrospinota bacterium]
MDILTALRIGASGLAAQRLRMNLISSNLANIRSTRTPGGGPYRRKDVYFVAAPLEGASFQKELASAIGEHLSEVRVREIVEDPRPLRRVYDPSHPDADKEGYVTLPNVNLIEEMVNLLDAARSYEAGVAAINTAKSMALKALEIGR